MEWHKLLDLETKNTVFTTTTNWHTTPTLLLILNLKCRLVKEVEGIHNRTDFDLSQHAKYSGKKIEYFDPKPINLHTLCR